MDIKPLIKNMTDASFMVPLIKEYLEIAVKNDDNLVRLTGIVQRLLAVGSRLEGDDALGLSEDERKQLMSEAESLLNIPK